jgi:hypothetical protein
MLTICSVSLWESVSTVSFGLDIRRYVPYKLHCYKVMVVSSWGLVPYICDVLLLVGFANISRCKIQRKIIISTFFHGTNTSTLFDITTLIVSRG